MKKLLLNEGMVPVVLGSKRAAWCVLGSKAGRWAEPSYQLWPSCSCRHHVWPHGCPRPQICCGQSSWWEDSSLWSRGMELSPPFPQLYTAMRSQRPLLLLTSIVLFKGVEPTKKGWSCGFMTLVHLLFIWKSHHPMWRGCTLREVMKYCHWPTVRTICLSQGYSGIWWRVLLFLCGLFHLIYLDSLLIF